MVCVTRGGFELYLYYFRVGTELSVGCTQVRRLCLSFMPRESIRCRQVGPAGLPYAGRLGDAAIWPPPLRGCSWFPREVGDSCVAPKQVVRGRPTSPRPVGLALARFGLHCSGTSVTSCKLLIKSVWVLNLGYIIGIGLNLTWFKPFGLNLWILPETPLGRLDHVLRAMIHKVTWCNFTGVGRPAWESPHFSSFSYMLLLNSNTHQNLWNLLMLVKIITK